MVQIKSISYSQKMLAKIGRIVIKQHPDIATDILSQWPTPRNTDLSQIPKLFDLYCQEINVQQEVIKKCRYNYALTEAKKVFVAVMIQLYREPYCFKKQIAETVHEPASFITKIISEVKFRYNRDSDFTFKVDTILNKLNTTS